jgi:NAD(P)-dependent dehydrogenase (short-subunit alcohol dehydrogenase family)
MTQGNGHVDRQVAIVTGGARGIGIATATLLAERGYLSVIADIDGAVAEDAAKSITSAGHRAAAVQVDVGDRRSVEAMIKTVIDTHGQIDVLINNAGIAGPTAKVEDIRPEDWERCIAVDLNGMFYCTRKAMPLIKAAGGGSIINLSSIAGRFGFPMRTPYAAAKWAVVGFTESLAAEAGPDKVRVNCIQPGIVEGDRVDRIIEAKAKGLKVSPEEIKSRMVAGISLHTTVTPQDIANMALFLATAPGRHISGQALSVCGGARYLV